MPASSLAVFLRCFSWFSGKIEASPARWGLCFFVRHPRASSSISRPNLVGRTASKHLETGSRSDAARLALTPVYQRMVCASALLVGVPKAAPPNTSSWHSSAVGAPSKRRATPRMSADGASRLPRRRCWCRDRKATKVSNLGGRWRPAGQLEKKRRDKSVSSLGGGAQGRN